MNRNGYILLHRKIQLSWQWTNPVWRSAWIWMLMEAEYEDRPELGLKRGQFFSSAKEIGDEGGMGKTAAARFLATCVDEGDLLWEKGFGGKFGTQYETAKGTQSGIGLSRFTIIKYDCYQPRPGTQYGTQSGTASPNSSILNKKEKNRLVSNETEKVPRKKATKKVDELFKILGDIDRRTIAQEFPNVDARAEWSEFQRYVLEGTPANPTPNPRNWKDLSMAWRNWCRRKSTQGGGYQQPEQTPASFKRFSDDPYKPL